MHDGLPSDTADLATTLSFPDAHIPVTQH